MRPPHESLASLRTLRKGDRAERRAIDLAQDGNGGGGGVVLAHVRQGHRRQRTGGGVVVKHRHQLRRQLRVVALLEYQGGLTVDEEVRGGVFGGKNSRPVGHRHQGPNVQFAAGGGGDVHVGGLDDSAELRGHLLVGERYPPEQVEFSRQASRRSLPRPRGKDEHRAVELA